MKYNLDDRDRVAAATALRNSDDGAHFKYAEGTGKGPTDLVIGKGSALGTTTHMAFTEDGEITKP